MYIKLKERFFLLLLWSIVLYVTLIDKALYKLSLIIDTLVWHLSINLPYYKSLPQISCFLWKSRKMHQKLLMLEVAKRKNKVHQGWHVPTKMCVCAYIGYLTFLVEALAKMHFLWLPSISQLSNLRILMQIFFLFSVIDDYILSFFLVICHMRLCVLATCLVQFLYLLILVTSWFINW